MIAQALAHKEYTEALRSMNTVMVQFWQFNEIWPTGGWGSIECKKRKGEKGLSCSVTDLVQHPVLPH